MSKRRTARGRHLVHRDDSSYLKRCVQKAAPSALLAIISSHRHAHQPAHRRRIHLAMCTTGAINARKATALEVKQQLQQLQAANIHLRGKTVLDVGFDLGFNGQAMAALGATVFGVEPKSDAYGWAIHEKTMVKENTFHGKLQDLPKGKIPPCDLATVFLWCVYRAEYDAFLSALSRAITPTGTVIIGIHGETYMYDPHGVAVPPHVRRYFGQVDTYRFPDMWNQYLLICKYPKL